MEHFHVCDLLGYWPKQLNKQLFNRGQCIVSVILLLPGAVATMPRPKKHLAGQSALREQVCMRLQEVQEQYLPSRLFFNASPSISSALFSSHLYRTGLY